MHLEMYSNRGHGQETEGYQGVHLLANFLPITILNVKYFFDTWLTIAPGYVCSPHSPSYVPKHIVLHTSLHGYWLAILKLHPRFASIPSYPFELLAQFLV